MHEFVVDYFEDETSGTGTRVSEPTLVLVSQGRPTPQSLALTIPAPGANYRPRQPRARRMHRMHMGMPLAGGKILYIV